MIIDLILDRKENANKVVRDGKLYITPEYNAKRFYNDVAGYEEIGYGIGDALDGGEEKDVKRELCNYIKENGYNEAICDYINSVNWLA